MHKYVFGKKRPEVREETSLHPNGRPGYGLAAAKNVAAFDEGDVERAIRVLWHVPLGDVEEQRELSEVAIIVRGAIGGDDGEVGSWCSVRSLGRHGGW